MTQPFTALIAARAGSKRFVKKNVALLGGKPLYQHSIDQAFAAGANEVLISTDISEILSAPALERVVCCERPPELAGDRTSITDVLLDLLVRGKPNSEVLVLLQPTSPLRPEGAIRECVEKFMAERSDDAMVMSVTPVNESVQKYGTLEGARFRAMRSNKDCFSNAQSLDQVYRPNGSIYVFTADGFRKHSGFPYAHIIPFIMDAAHSIDIDYPEDFERVAKAFDGLRPK